jgi:hypothetical protein
MKYLKRTPIKFSEYMPKHREKTIMSSIVRNQSDAYLRYGNFSHEIIDGRTCYVFPPDNIDKNKLKNMRKGIYLFALVRKNAKDWLLKNKSFKLPKKNPVNEYASDTFEFDNQKLTGTDINSAYWTIAYNLNIITEDTYERGLINEFKQLRLATLSTLGSGKKYYVIKDGELTNKEVCIGSNEKMADVYKLIRYTCYTYMNELKKLLGASFVAYRTDCIYYVDTKENRLLVHQYLKGKKLKYKQLYEINKNNASIK